MESLDLEEKKTLEEKDNDSIDETTSKKNIVTIITVSKIEESVPDVKDFDPDDKNLDIINVKVIFNKTKHDVSAPSNRTIGEFKKQLATLLDVPTSMQKLMYKGLLQDDQTLSSSGITKGSKIMLVGSKLQDIFAISSVNKKDFDTEKATATKEPLCKNKIHKKVLDKGVPEDAMPGIKDLKEGLPMVSLTGMLNKHGGKVRLTFKMESDQLWLSTKERTEKLPMGSIKGVVSEPIENHEEYHILGLQLGPTEASRYWIYWVPAQYVDAIKDSVLGKWQYF